MEVSESPPPVLPLPGNVVVAQVAPVPVTQWSSFVPQTQNSEQSYQTDLHFTHSHSPRITRKLFLHSWSFESASHSGQLIRSGIPRLRDISKAPQSSRLLKLPPPTRQSNEGGFSGDTNQGMAHRATNEQKLIPGE